MILYLLYTKVFINYQNIVKTFTKSFKSYIKLKHCKHKILYNRIKLNKNYKQMDFFLEILELQNNKTICNIC